jgi:hypothetical protein
MDRIKKPLHLMEKYVWAVLLALYPFADQILAMAEVQLPVLQPVLGANAFRYMGLAIVVAKFALQAWRCLQQLRALLANIPLRSDEAPHG